MNAKLAPAPSEATSSAGRRIADVSDLSASAAAEYVRSAETDGDLSLERMGGRTFVVADDRPQRSCDGDSNALSCSK